MAMSEFTYDGIDPVVLYDMFYEMGTQLGGHIIAMARTSDNEAESTYWRHCLRAVDDERDSIDWRDTDAQILAIERWKQERDDLAAILETARDHAHQPVAV